MSKLLTFAATGFAGLVLGAGIGAAAADQDGSPRMPAPYGDVSSMDEMHATMADQMPAELAEQCDEMHASMGSMMDGMGSMGSMGSMTNRMGAGMSDHEAHHPGTEG